MPNKKKAGGGGTVKMSLGDFVGPQSVSANALPTAPKERAAGDDGSFQRRPRRSEQQDYVPSRSEEDTSWRRGGPSGGGGGFGGGGSGGGGGYGDRDNRRVGVGAGGDDGGRWRSRGGGGFGDSSNSRGGIGGGPPPPSAGERPRFQLKSRTRPVDNVENNSKSETAAAAPPSKPKVNPFGSAKAVDTASKLNKLDIKDKEPEKEKALPPAEDKAENPPPAASEETEDSGGAWSKVGGPSSSSSSSEVKKETTNTATDNDAGEKKKKDGENNSNNNNNRKKMTEPKVVNSRAALMGRAPERDNNSDRRRERHDRNSSGDNNNNDNSSNNRNSSPPPVRNERFAQLAEEEREKNRIERENRSLRHQDRGPPPAVQNSRFAAAAEADRSYSNNNNDDLDDNRGPPPTANSRFAAAAEADRSYNRNDMNDDRGPPPVANSRFARASAMAAEEEAQAQQERAERYGGADGGGFGPPPVPQNSRFAAAVAADNDYVDRDRRGDDRGPPPVNSRFAAAAAADQDYYADRESRGRNNNSDRDRFGLDGAGSSRGSWGSRGSSRDEQQQGYGGSRNYNDPPARDFDGGADRRPSSGRGVDDLLKPKVAVRADNILKAPTAKPAPEHEANLFKVPEKKKKEPEAVEQEPEAEPEPQPDPKAEPDQAVNTEELLEEFASMKMLGEELKAWCAEQGSSLPPVKQLVYRMLTKCEKLNPDPDCGWAEPSKFGAALVSLVEDDVYGQMQVLWGIQLYCDDLCFPKLNEEYVVQSMFRAMYKYDLAGDDAFEEWKEDESEEHETGKIKAVIQTIDWFNWLEEDDDDDEEEDEYEEEEE